VGRREEKKGRKAERKKGRKKERKKERKKRAARTGSEREREKTTFLQLQTFFYSCKKTL